MTHRQPEKWFARIAGLLIGFLTASYTFGWDILFGTGEAGKISGDASTTLTGMRYFLAEGWNWPLLHVEGLNTPDGVSIAFTDSIPLWSIIAKLCGPLGLPPETWFGLWFLTIYVLQGFFAVEALRAWGVKKPAVLLAGAIIAVSMPFFVYRVFHPALSGHFIILAAWAVAGHLRTIKADDRKLRIQCAAAAVIIASFLIHPYLFVTTIVPICGALLDSVRRRQFSYAAAASWVGGLGVMLGGVAFAGGYITSGAVKESGYGFYGVVAAGAFIPQRSDIFPGDDQIIAVNASNESYAWIGFGLFLASMVALVIAVRSWKISRDVIQNHQLLLLAVIALQLYAITPVVHISGLRGYNLFDNSLGPIPITLSMIGLGGLICAAAVVLRLLPSLGVSTDEGVLGATSALFRRWPVLAVAGAAALAVGASLSWYSSLWEPITGQSRASGRFYWAVGYGLFVLFVAVIDRIKKVTITTGLVILISVLQFFDVGTVRSGARTNFEPTPDQVRDVTTYADIIALHDQVTLPDRLKCLEGHNRIRFQNVLTASSIHARPINNVIGARIGVEAKGVCPETQTVSLEDGQVGFYFGDVEVDPEVLADSTLRVNDMCRTNTYVTVCTKSWDEVDAQLQLSDQFSDL